MENLYTKDCIRTRSGLYVNVFNPNPDTIIIEDIAHALSMQCRFGGHLPSFYSVAQHSVECCNMAEDKYKLQALMHDASEAYLLDIPRPIKQGLSNYKEIENNLMIVIAEKFGFEYPLSSEVKRIDEVQLQYEWDEIMINNKGYSWIPLLAKDKFLQTFKKLSND